MKYILLALLVSNTCLAETVYNPYTHAYEPGTTVRYNAYTGQHTSSYANDQLKYNSYSKTYNYAPSDSQTKYNPYTHAYEATTKNSELTYNPRTNSYYYNRTK